MQDGPSFDSATKTSLSEREKLKAEWAFKRPERRSYFAVSYQDLSYCLFDAMLICHPDAPPPRSVFLVAIEESIEHDAFKFKVMGNGIPRAWVTDIKLDVCSYGDAIMDMGLLVWSRTVFIELLLREYEIPKGAWLHRVQPSNTEHHLKVIVAGGDLQKVQEGQSLPRIETIEKRTKYERLRGRRSYLPRSNLQYAEAM
jgi:hypothetical protein